MSNLIILKVLSFRLEQYTDQSSDPIDNYIKI